MARLGAVRPGRHRRPDRGDDRGPAGRLTRLDLPLLLGAVVTGDPDRARVAGFFIHLVIGQGFALGYAASFSLLDRATWWLGGLLRQCVADRGGAGLSPLRRAGTRR